MISLGPPAANEKEITDLINQAIHVPNYHYMMLHHTNYAYRMLTNSVFENNAQKVFDLYII